ncbi:GAF domain-containing sensor histidine kinase [Chroococcidiopsis sp. CCNUC1]|jgi:two-component system, sensor histidine kinase and response regulator|uniref:GAF domain-containing sensor histidine kinase n=1 Tax=Chroococcidiopsis sp. CCNUC1 TaxID=2653189 RepID=UPI002020178C|nr:GAF domain-containing sensor histidine kinase [Chroococcidiopsis sp. CCNUC1]URD50671.1 GAF domain-containing sensor histidine kinase [Chroococcidiopsis sp. CCNUC1]
MSSSQDLSFHQLLPLTIFQQLGQLLQQMAQELGNEALIVTEEALVSIPTRPEATDLFTLVVSQQFSALLVAERRQETGDRRQQEELTLKESIILNSVNSELGTEAYVTLQERNSELLNVKLTFEPAAIAQFLQHLNGCLEDNSLARATLARYSQVIQPNNATLQGKFTLMLLSVLAPSSHQNDAQESIYPFVSVCQPVEEALHQQIAHERLLNQVTTQIRQSLELPIIISNVVERVREFLQVDRLVVYQFEQQESAIGEQLPVIREQGIFNSEFRQPKAKRSVIPNSEFSTHGCVIYEARASASIDSVLNYREENCFVPASGCWEKYRQGFTLAIADVDKAYVLSSCLLAFLQKIQVRAKLIAPIVFQQQLWGLLIAHQCYEPRSWQENEKNLLRRIAEQLAIAIYQEELMRSLKLEKQTLEQRVIERTQALHDALLAAQAASRAKSEFLATMSHELRTPLTSVIGMSSTLLRWPSGEMSQRQRQFLQTIHDSGEHLLALINDILELTQFESGKAVLNLSEFALAQLAEASLRSLSDRATRQAVNIMLDLKISPDYRLFADPQRVSQILWNLLSNAIKFTPEGGEAILRIWSENDFAVIQVEDTGIGIAEEHLPLIFEKFQQLDSPYQRHYDGTGLGLALTKQLVELHQGRIEVESTLGKGSIFTVWLPNNREQ